MKKYETSTIPNAFWGALTQQQFNSLLARDGVLNQQEIDLLWRLTDRQTNKPKPGTCRVLIPRRAFEEALSKLPKAPT